MEATDSLVKARIGKAAKMEATEILDSMGLSMSEAIRLMVHQIIAERRLPFAIKTPNAVTQAARDEFKNGKRKPFKSVKDLMVHLNAGS